MAEKVMECAGCHHHFTTRIMRYVKNASGGWDYLCADCRRERKLPK